MPNPNNFDEAMEATEEMFNNEQTLAETDGNEEVVAEDPVQEEEQTVEDSTQEEALPATEAANGNNRALEEAAQTAEVAAQVASEKNAQLEQAVSENEQLRQQNSELLKTISQMSQQQKEAIVEEAMEMPTLDIGGLAFADDETVKQAEAEYAQRMADFVKGGVMKDLAPFVEQAKEGIYQKEKNAAISALSQVPELSGIETLLPQLDKIIANNKWLQSEDMSVEERFINAYAIARGVNAINTPPEEPKKELTSEELMELYDKNPDFQELVEKKRLEQIKQSQQVPPFSASSGAVNAALNIKEKPKTFDEAAERTRRMFGLE